MSGRREGETDENGFTTGTQRLTEFHGERPMDQEERERAYPEEELTGTIIGAAIEVHRRLGPGLLESAYEECLCIEFDIQGIPYKRQEWISIDYKGHVVHRAYRLDLIVMGRVIVDVKSVEEIIPIHLAQVLTYLRVTTAPVGLLLNFNVPVLKKGIKKVVL